jgi:hypothetical protein
MAVDFTGTWKADLSQSKLPGPVPKAITVTIDHSDPDLHQQIIVTREDGSAQHITFKCVTNGKPDHCQLDEKAVRGRARWEGEELVIELRIQSGARELYLRDCWSLAADGQTLTMKHRDDALAGQVTVLRRE